MSLWSILGEIFKLFIVLPAIIVLIPIYLLVQLLGLPYTIYYYSPNWGLSESDMPAVQLYIDHFQSLYPDLISSVAEAHKLAGRIDKQKLRAIDFWPHGKSLEIRPSLLPVNVDKQWTFSQATGLLCRLETVGWRRVVVWAFLRDTVEQSGRVSQEQKERFATVMEKMCNHDLKAGFFSICNKALPSSWQRLRGGDRDMPMGIPVVQVREDSLQWLLQKGTFLVAENSRAKQRMRALSRFQLWGKVSKDVDLVEGLGGKWQLLDLRR
jgi:hypothetical protein